MGIRIGTDSEIGRLRNLVRNLSSSLGTINSSGGGISGSFTGSANLTGSFNGSFNGCVTSSCAVITGSFSGSFYGTLTGSFSGSYTGSYSGSANLTGSFNGLHSGSYIFNTKKITSTPPNTSSYTASFDDYLLLCSGAVNIRLPNATTYKGRMFTIKNIGINVITIVSNTSSQYIDNLLTASIKTTYSSYNIISAENNWWIV